MNQLQPVEYSNQRILTSQLLADAYGTEEKYIRQNFTSNQHRYTAGKHYFLLEGEELKAFLNLHTLNLGVQTAHSKIRTLYLWTEKGAWMHAKSLNTDEAWDAYEKLVDDYYHVKQQLLNTSQTALIPFQNAAITLVEAEAQLALMRTQVAEMRKATLDLLAPLEGREELVLEWLYNQFHFCSPGPYHRYSTDMYQYIQSHIKAALEGTQGKRIIRGG